MKRKLLVTFPLWLALALFLTSPLTSAVIARTTAEPPAGSEKAIVLYVIDGDTFQVEMESGHREERIRMIGIDTPETTDSYGNEPECYGEEAHTFTNAILEEGQEVWLESDLDPEDDYDRLLRYVWFYSAEDGQLYLLNEVLVEQGFAEAKHYQPNLARQTTLDDAEEEARDENIGLWAGCSANLKPNDPPSLTIHGNTPDSVAITVEADDDEDYACSFFYNQDEAQEFLEAYPQMQEDLDPDRNNVACDGYEFSYLPNLN